MSDSISLNERYAKSFGPPPDNDHPDSPAARTASSPDAPSGPTGSAPEIRPDPSYSANSSAADFGAITLSVSLPFFSLSVSRTTDRLGHEYYGVGVSAGLSASLPAGGSVSAGNVVGGIAGEKATEEELKNVLCGDSISARVGMGYDVGVTNSSGGTAMEWGAATSVGASVGFTHNWGDRCP